MATADNIEIFVSEVTKNLLIAVIDKHLDEEAKSSTTI